MKKILIIAMMMLCAVYASALEVYTYGKLAPEMKHEAGDTTYEEPYFLGEVSVGVQHGNNIVAYVEAQNNVEIDYDGPAEWTPFIQEAAARAGVWVGPFNVQTEYVFPALTDWRVYEGDGGYLTGTIGFDTRRLSK